MGNPVASAVLAACLITIVGLAQPQENPGAAGAPAKLATASTNLPAAAKEKPLLLGDEKPLLLLDDDPGTNAPVGGADNSRCQVCHLNFMQEALSVTHAKTNIGCATCHGPSDNHIADESWASGGNGTAPDIMFRKSQIRFACLGCHNWVKLVENDQRRTDLKEKPDHQAVLAGTHPDKKFCTDCHGKHRMVTRKCRWK
jgi:hypothetical protein